MVFSDPLEALQNIGKIFWQMKNDGEFIGIMEHLIDNAQAEV